MRGLIRRDPTVGLSPFQEVDKLFDDIFNSFSLPVPTFHVPAVNIYNDDTQNMIVELEVPGYESENIDININKNVLEVRGQRQEKDEEAKKRSYMVRENSQSFARRIVLPEGADGEHIAAELDKGMLKITIPVEQHETKRITISSKNAEQPKLAAGKKTDTSKK